MLADHWHEGIRHSDQFTKTVYVKFEETDNIIKLSKQLTPKTLLVLLVTNFNHT